MKLTRGGAERGSGEDVFLQKQNGQINNGLFVCEKELSKADIGRVSGKERKNWLKNIHKCHWTDDI